MSAAPAGAAATGSVWRPKYNPWLIAVVVAMAAFMEVLDTSIANVALPYIGGSMGSSYEESTWVLTSYLVSNAIVLPISGWLAVRFGRKRFFLACLTMFTLSSLLCGFATSLALLLGFRILQGVGGGGLQPMAQAILADSFPPEQRGLAFALYAITAILAPTIGPTLGGWITFNYSWRWIFFINLPVGVLAMVLILRLIEDPPYLARLKVSGVRIDYVGVALLVLGVGALQIMLDRGQQDDWFGSAFITTLAIVAVVGLVTLVVWSWFHAQPIIDVRLFRNFNYASANAMMFVLGILLFSSLVLMPQFLQTLLGYTAELAGLVLSGGAVVLLLALPIVGQLTTRLQARHIAAFGWLCLAIAMFYSTKRIEQSISFSAATWLRAAQVVGLGFLFVPITLVAYVGVPAEKTNTVAGMINFMRNMGSSVGTSLVTTMIARRSQFHQTMLVEHASPGNPAFQSALEGMTSQLIASGVSPADARAHAYPSLYRAIQAQAATLAYIDVYWILGIGALIMFGMSFLLAGNDPRAGGARAAAE
jgi:MFS transporter, DHA2 family, multidrug resistance protein